MSENKHKTGFRGPSPGVGKATQFKPGQTGNPGGRPKTALLSEAYRRKLGELVPDDPEGRTYAALIADTLAANAAKGDIHAAREMADRAEGRARQPIEHAVDSNWAAVLEEAQRRLDAYRARTIDVPALPPAEQPAAAGSDSLLPAGEPDTWQETRDAQHIPQAAAPAPAPPGEDERKPQEPSQDRWAGLGSTQPSGKQGGGPHVWTG